MISRRRLGMLSFATCLAACSSQQPVVASADSQLARGAQSTDAAPPAPATSFRASLASGPSQTADDSLLSAAFEREAAAAQRQSMLRDRADGPFYPRVGDVVHVDVSSYNEADALSERVRTVGLLESRTADIWRVRDSHTRKLVAIQLRESDWSRGVYWRRTTGKRVVNPLYYVEIERHASSPASGRIIGRVVPKY